MKARLTSTTTELSEGKDASVQFILVILSLSVIKLKVKFSHTRYRALGPELIPVYRQSARR